MAPKTVPAVQVDHVSLRCFAASSGSRPNLRHFVTVQSSGRLVCSCEAGRYGKTDCRHRTAVVEHLAGFGWDGQTVTPAPESIPLGESFDSDPFFGLVAA